MVSVWESSADRLTRARAWFDTIDDARLSWDDVELVVRLRVTDPSFARTLLLSDDAVLRHWDLLAHALAPAVDSSSASSAGSPVTAAVPEGIVGERYTALRDWRDGQTGPGSGIGDDDLLVLAQSPPSNNREYKKLGALVYSHAAQLRAVLDGVDEVPQHDATASAAVPADTAAASSPASASSAAPPVSSGAPVETESAPATSGHVAPSEARRTGATSIVDFAHFTYPEAGSVAPTPGSVVFDATGGESVHLSWPSAPDDSRIHVFSVVTKSEYLPSASPTLGDVVASTFDAAATDTSLFRSAVRYVAIWLSSGPTEQAARAAQPTLWAVGDTVLPVRGCTVREDEGTVIGNWEPVPGADHFDVYRVPIGSGLESRHGVDVDHKLPVHVVTSGGFTDRDAVPGTTYEYRVYAVAQLGGADRSSPPVARTVTLEAVAEQVTDLKVTATADSATSFDLTWTEPPIGKVEIYRTSEPPRSGIDDRDLDRAALEGQGGLTAALRVERAREYDGTRVSLHDVPWPTGWSRAYFTPVTVVNENLIRVGPSQSLTRAGAPSQVRLIERVDRQFLTFAWPLGSPTVRVYQGSRGSTHVDPQVEQPIYDISEEDYGKYGGAHLRHPLPAEGCSVHVVGVSYSGGRARYSLPVTVQYEGLARLRYRFETPPPAGRGRRQTAPSRRLMVWSEQAFDVDLVLVHHERRLPLHVRDGAELARRPMSVGQHPQVAFEPVDAAGRVGFVRMFADVPMAQAHRLAVLDPPLHELRLGHQ